MKKWKITCILYGHYWKFNDGNMICARCGKLRSKEGRLKFTGKSKPGSSG